MKIKLKMMDESLIVKCAEKNIIMKIERRLKNII